MSLMIFAQERVLARALQPLEQSDDEGDAQEVHGIEGKG